MLTKEDSNYPVAKFIAGIAELKGHIGDRIRNLEDEFVSALVEVKLSISTVPYRKYILPSFGLYKFIIFTLPPFYNHYIQKIKNVQKQ